MTELNQIRVAACIRGYKQKAIRQFTVFGAAFQLGQMGLRAFVTQTVVVWKAI